ncbi:MAG TPA: hypothetical protein VNV37_06960 [Solirubrobacteraceae bacterium]|nr:hypothetical protein [Solirubrobacteraceae bacterium]
MLVLLAVLMLGATVAATVAYAEEGPSEPLAWQAEGKTLAANETREITITRWSAHPETAEPIVLEAGTLKVSCEEAKAGKDAFLANGSKGAVTVSSPELSKCTTSGNGEGCKVKEPLVAKPVIDYLVLNDEEGFVGRKVLTELDPVAGSETLFLTAEFIGEKCKLSKVEVGKGLTIGSLYTDPLVVGGEPEYIERLRNFDQLSSYLIKYPDVATSIFFWNPNPIGWLLFTITKLKAGTETATLRGTLLLLLSRNGKSTGEKFGLRE